MITRARPARSAADCSPFVIVPGPGTDGSRMNATRWSFGKRSFSSSSCLGAISPARFAMPVTLPPGRPRLATAPLPTGSETSVNTMGMMEVAAFAASVPGVALVTITSTFSATSSAASAGMRSLRLSACRYSMTRFLPSTQPSAASRLRKAVSRIGKASLGWSRPMRRTGCVCARAHGETAAAPTAISANIDSRLSMRSPDRFQATPTLRNREKTCG